LNNWKNEAGKESLVMEMVPQNHFAYVVSLIEDRIMPSSNWLPILRAFDLKIHPHEKLIYHNNIGSLESSELQIPKNLRSYAYSANDPKICKIALAKKYKDSKRVTFQNERNSYLNGSGNQKLDFKQIRI